MKNTLHTNPLREQNALLIVANAQKAKLYSLKSGTVARQETVPIFGIRPESLRSKFFRSLNTRLRTLNVPYSSVYLFAPEKIMSGIKAQMPKEVEKKIDSEFWGNYTGRPLASLFSKIQEKREEEVKSEVLSRTEKQMGALLDEIEQSGLPVEKFTF